MTSQVTIRVDDLSQGVIVPVVAVAQDGESSYCFRQADNWFEATQVKLGENTEDYVEILSGLQAGDRVALDARARLAAKQEKDQSMDLLSPAAP